jgi:FKBP-type peptidyl-prolyl cis-trans isomerase SlyD
VKIENNTIVTVDYILRNDQQEEIYSSENEESIVYLHGGDELLDGLERALDDKSVGDQFSVTLQPDEAYGDEQPELIQTMHMDEFNGVEMREGMELQGKDPEGNYQLLRVQKVDGDQVTVNMNHPLAGMVLKFEVEVKGIRPATEEELAHGHAH